MKITKKQLRQIIKEELGSDPEGEAAYSSQLRKAKSAKKLNTSVEEVEAIADLMANDPEFRMFRNFVDKFKRYSKSGGAAVSSLEAAIPEYVPGKLIMKLVAKAQESLTGDEKPMPKPKSPAASAADMDRWESDYRNENKMKITEKQLRQIIKGELMKEVEESPEIHDDETKTILKDLVNNMQNKFNVSEEDALEAISKMLRYMEK